MKNIEEELKALPEKFIALVVIPADKMEEVSIEVLNALTKKYRAGSYITVNRPYKNMVKIMESKNINERNLFFIDCITDYLREKEAIVRNCYFVDSPTDLTEIGIALDPLLKDKIHQFLILDSVDTLKIYNNTESVIKFTHFLTGKLRIHDMSGIFLMVDEKSDEKFVHQLGQFCDKVIHLD
ncbi:MAG: hypothetical protein ABIH63_00740 [archaeon]